MIEKVISKIKEYNKDVKIVSTIVFYEKDIRIIKDARSATFFAMGEGAKGNDIVLILTSDELQSAYTAITEAWFQKIKLCVISINKETYTDTRFLERCMNSIITINTESEVVNLNKKFLEANGPKLINIMEVNEVEKLNDYEAIVSQIRRSNNNIEIIVYNGNDTEVKNIETQYRYGVLSKYLGKTIVSHKESVLICTADIFMLDLNVFNNRHITEKFKTIVVDKNNLLKQSNIGKWIDSNSINIYTGYEEIDKLLNGNRPGVLIIGGEN